MTVLDRFLMWLVLLTCVAVMTLGAWWHSGLVLVLGFAGLLYTFVPRGRR